MSQVKASRCSAEAFCRSRGFKAGYEDYRRSSPPRFGEWKRHNLAYEYGRLVAANLSSEMAILPEVVLTKTPPPELLALLVETATHVNRMYREWWKA